MAIQAGAAMPLTAWTKQTRAESPLVRAGVIQIIGSQGGDGAVPPVLAGLDDSDEVVRLAAIFAASLLDHGSLVGPLLTRLTGAKAEAVAAKRSLLQMRGPAFDTALASEVSSGEVGSRLQAIDIVAQRKSQSAQPALLEALGDANADIRKAALKALREMGNREALASVLTLLKSGDTRERREAEAAASGICKRERGGSCQAVSQALASSSGELRAALLRVSSQIGGKDAVKMVLASVADSDPAVKDAAVRSLSEWPDGAAIQPLLDIIASDASQSQHVLAVRGALRLIGEERSKDPDKVAKIAKVLASARSPEERKLALSTLSNLKHPAALQTSATYLENVDLKVEAGLAVFKIAERIYKSHPAPSKEALSKLIATSADQKLKDRASKLLQKFAPEVPTLP
jgi:HEAT repeat protein